MRTPGLPLALLLSLLASPAAGAPQGAGEAAPPRPVVVGTREVPPFAMRAEDGSWSGLAIDLWEGVAEELGLSTTYRATGLTELLDEVADGGLDVVAAALTVTAERERRMDFSHAFLSSGIGIATRTQGRSSVWSVAARVVSPAFLRAVLTLAALLFVCGFFVWVFERRKNRVQFGGGLRGLGDGFWWSAVTMTTVGYGDKAPQTLGGRAVALVWMFTSIIVISSFTASIASSLTVEQLATGIQGPDELAGARLGTVGASTSAAWIERRLLRATRYDSAEEALAALEADRLDAVVYDAPVLRYLVSKRFGRTLTVLPAPVERQEYAFAFPTGSDLREGVNQAVLERTGSEDWERALERYFGN